jgi:hypothetical protein
LCDIPPPLDFSKDHVDTHSDSNDDSTSYGEIEYVEVSLPHSDVDPLHSLSCQDISYEPVNPKENVNLFVPETFNTTLTNPLFEFESEFTMISNNPIFDEDCDESTMEHEFTNSHLVNNSLHEEFSSELTHHITTPPEFDSPGGDTLNYENLQIPTHPPGLFTSLPFEIQTQAIEPPLEEEDQIMIFVMVFFLFFTYQVTSSLLHSFGSEDTIFDPGILMYHYLEPDANLIGVELSRASYVCPNILSESPIEIISSTSCFPKEK